MGTQNINISAKNVILIRKALGMKQDEFALAIGVNERTLADYERENGRNLSKNSAQKIADYVSKRAEEIEVPLNVEETDLLRFFRMASEPCRASVLTLLKELAVKENLIKGKNTSNSRT
jgi:transcriptional regulator with XRE-family HTH domain